MKKRLHHLSVVLLCGILLLASGCSQQNDRPQHYRLLYSIFFPSTHIHSKLARQWADEIEARTGGRVTIDIYCGSLLSAAGDNYECVVNGVSDLGMSCFSYSRGMFPMLEGLDLPWGYTSGSQATRIANKFIAEFHPAELDETEIMYVHAHGPGVLASKRPVPDLATLSTLSIRGTGITAQVVRSLGANPIGLSQGDTYEALRKGVVEGTLCPMETLKGWRQGEVIEHITTIPAIGYTTVMFVTMNKKTWARLPQDIREIILQANQEWQDKHGLAWDQADQEGLAFVTSLGRQCSNFPSEENAKVAEKLQPLLQNWADNLEKKGLPGHKALQFLQQEIAKP
jgi:TRAP-type C4-dicarboxylate transport system substrate-binding protein